MVMNRMLKRTIFSRHCSFAFMLIFLFGCTDSSNVSSLTKQSLIYCSEASPNGFNPQLTIDSATINATSNQLYDRLITLNTVDNTLLPAIAKSWHVTRDGKKITFYLQKNITFHTTEYFSPTRTLTADDIIFSFQRIIDKSHPFHEVSSGEYPYFEQIGFSRLVESINKVDDYTIQFVLYEPNASFLTQLATQYSIILSEEYGSLLAQKNQHSLIDTQPIGTGPFKFQEFRVGSFIRYYQHPEYWGKNSEFKQLVFDITTQNTSRLTKLMTGECDIISQPIGHNKINERTDLTLEALTSLDVAFLAFNTLEPPFNNANIRQAIAHAIDKKAIVDTVYLGHGVTANSLLPSSSWAHTKKNSAPEYNIKKAQKLMADEGYAEGFDMDMLALPEKVSYVPNALTLAILLKEQLKKININVMIKSDINQQSNDGFLSPTKYQSIVSGWSAIHPDPDNFFSTLLSCSATQTDTNQSNWCYQPFDTLLEKAIQTNLVAQRQYYYQQAQQLLNQQMPLIPLAHSTTYKAKSKKIIGQYFNPFGINFSHISKL